MKKERPHTEYEKPAEGNHKAGYGHRKVIVQTTGVLGAATSLSRVTGLVRDIVVAAQFGAGMVADAFFMAFTIPNLLRRFFAEGSLTAAFVPTFSEVYHRQGHDDARKMANICFTLLLLVMCGVVFVGIVCSPLLVRVIGFGFSAVEGKLALTDALNQVMFPYIFLVSLLALMTGILNVLGHFFLPALSPVFLNLGIILCAVVVAPWLDAPVFALAIGVLLGGIVQVALQIPVLIRKGMGLRFDFNFRHPAVQRVVRLMLPGIAGVAIYQINIVVTRLLASFLIQGSVSYLYYGQRMFEFPQGVFVASLAQAVLPTMSRHAAAGETEGINESLRFGLRLIFLVTIPATVGLVLCATPIFSLLFMGGEFTYSDVQLTAYALMAYAPGLVFVGTSRILVPAFYAMQDTRTPVVISFWTLLVNAGLGLALMGPLKHVGLALALTLSSVFNAGALVWALKKKLGVFSLGGFRKPALQIIFLSLAMGLVVWFFLGLGSWEVPGEKWLKGGILTLSVGAGMTVFLCGCMLLRIPEAAELGRKLKARFAGKEG